MRSVAARLLLKPQDPNLRVLRAIYYVGLRDTEGLVRELSALKELPDEEVDAGVFVMVMAASLASMDADRLELADQLYGSALRRAPNAILTWWQCTRCSCAAFSGMRNRCDYFGRH